MSRKRNGVSGGAAKQVSPQAADSEAATKSQPVAEAKAPAKHSNGNGKVAPLPAAAIEAELAHCHRRLAVALSDHDKALLELAAVKLAHGTERQAAAELRRGAECLREAAEVAVRDALLAKAAARRAWLASCLLCAASVAAAAAYVALCANSPPRGAVSSTSKRIYVLGCFGAYVPNLYDWYCSCFGKYKDKRFPSEDKSLGNAARGKKVVWLTVEEILNHANAAYTAAEHSKDIGSVVQAAARHQMKNVALFSHDISPHDIKQARIRGGIGNCWMLSALACLATVSGGIPSCFVTKRYNAYGKYTVRMFDRRKGKAGKWQNVTVSDSFPCRADTRRPLFAKPNGETAWVHILEKAFAKFLGSYEALNGGSTLFALEVLTGDSVCQWNFNRETRTWANHSLVHRPSEPRERAFGVRKTGEQLGEYDMFKYLRAQSKKLSLIGASSGGGKDNKTDAKGIVQGHAYSILRVKEIDGFRLVQFRNPWGKIEWKGAWSDSSDLWQEFPTIAQKLGQIADDDGAFWMDWGDVQRHFDSIDLCIRVRGFRDLALDYNEELGCCGPCCGCLQGCAAFWCLCRGCRTAFANDYDIRQAQRRAQYFPK